MIYHYHIPKTGGVYVASNVEDLLLNQVGLKYTELREFFYFPHIDKEFVLNSEYIAGHYGTEPFDYVPDTKAFTTLRHPVNRVISHFSLAKNYFLQAPEYADLVDSNPNNDLQMMQAILKRWVLSEDHMLAKSNFQARFLTNKLDPAKQPIEEEKDFKLFKTATIAQGALEGWQIGTEIEPTFDGAMQTLSKMKVVGVVEKMDRFYPRLLTWLHEEFGKTYTWPNYPPANARPISAQLSIDLDPEVVDRLVELNPIDYQLWDWAQKL
jgi:hypothetical protein